jgi:hypothetical protein
MEAMLRAHDVLALLHFCRASTLSYGYSRWERVENGPKFETAIRYARPRQTREIARTNKRDRPLVARAPLPRPICSRMRGEHGFGGSVDSECVLRRCQTLHDSILIAPPAGGAATRQPPRLFAAGARLSAVGCLGLQAERREFQSGTGHLIETKEPPRSPNQPCHHTLLASRLCEQSNAALTKKM